MRLFTFMLKIGWADVGCISVRRAFVNTAIRLWIA